MKSLLLIFSLSFLSSAVVADPIHNAAVVGNLQEVQRLINEGVDVSAKDEKLNEWTALHFASHEGQLEMVRLLLANGADINAKADDKWTALHLASDEGRLEMVRLLIANKADINAKTDDKWTPLHLAAWNGRLELVKLLLEKGADINAKSIGLFNLSFLGGDTSLDIAKERGHNAIVQYLISKGAQ